MNQEIETQSVEESDRTRRTLIVTMIGVVIVSSCALLVLVYTWLQSDQSSILADYFATSTPTRRPSSTPVPTRTPAPNLTATQQAWVRPPQSPSLGSAEEARSALDAGTSQLEGVAFVFPDTPSINQPGDVYIYEISLSESEPLLWSYGWCTTTQEILEQNFAHIQLEFTVNGVPVSTGNFAVAESPRADGSPCREYTAVITEWPAGSHQLESRITFTQDIDDGWDVYPAGTHIFKYIVTVSP